MVFTCAHRSPFAEGSKTLSFGQGHCRDGTTGCSFGCSSPWLWAWHIQRLKGSRSCRLVLYSNPDIWQASNYRPGGYFSLCKCSGRPANTTSAKPHNHGTLAAHLCSLYIRAILALFVVRTWAARERRCVRRRMHSTGDADAFDRI